MPANTLDHRALAMENWGDLGTALATAFIVGSLDQSAPTLNLTATVGAALGTGPPAAVVLAGSNAFRGNVTFGSGTTPAAGIALTVLFPFPLPIPKAFVFLTATTQASGVLQASAIVTTAASQVTGFTINLTAAPAGSQGNTVYGYNWILVG